MSKSDENRSAMSGLIDSATKSGEPAGDETSQDDARKQRRERFSVYADRRVFNRVKLWSTFLEVSQADIMERALSQYCDKLADHHNDGEDPEIPKADNDTDPLL